MNYAIDDYGRLVITTDEEDRKVFASYEDDAERLRAVQDAFHCSLMENGPFVYVDPCVCGDLTDCEMVGILDEEIYDGGPGYDGGYDQIGTGYVKTGPKGRQRCLARWGDMSYAVRDWREDLLERGTVTWEGGFTDRENDASELRRLVQCDANSATAN